MEKYEPTKIEPKWQEIWEEKKIYQPDLDGNRKPFLDRRSQNFRGKFYNLMMFPYPSAEGLHVGNMYAFTGADVYGRFKRMQGLDVFEPIGLDGFGIHSENYAIKVSRHPNEQAKISEKNFYRQLRATGNAYDWSRTVETYSPDYYKWTQWIFIQLFKKGLAYRKKAPVNFCPSCKTVLADEQVIEGKCERCSSMVEKRELEQWFFKITAYADRLLNGLSQISWTEKVKLAQKQWIGKSEGVMLRFKVKDMDIHLEMFDSVPQTFMAQTFTVIAPEHPQVYELVKGTQYEKSVMGFVDKIKRKKSANKFDIEKETEGIFTGRYLEYTAAKRLLPIWVASFVIAEYGTGVVNASAHDERDFVFAKKYNLPLHPVMFPEDPIEAEKVQNLEYCYHHAIDGVLVEPAEFKGRKWGEVRNDIIVYIEKHGFGKRSSQYHLRDWLISRQRYWGPPIPMIYCQRCADKGISCSPRVILGRSKATTPESDSGQARMTKDNNMYGWFPVLEDQLPVFLPDVKDWKPEGTGKSPLASVDSFVNTKCPNCKGEAVRETDVSDTFLDSSWYFLRYLATDREDIPFPSKAFINSKHEALNPKQIQNSNDQNSKRFRISDLDIRICAQRARWLPVNMYIGGAEHSVLHLLYTRFLTMVFHDLGLINFQEPFPRFYAHGLMMSEGAKMSKSKGNVVVPDTYINKFGADTLRCYLMFIGPYSQGGDFRDSGIEGMSRFLKRVWRLIAESTQNKTQSNAEEVSVVQRKIPHISARMMHKTIKKVTEDMEGLRYNTAIAALMEHYNFLSSQKTVSREEIEVFLRLLAPLAPHLTEELWAQLGGKFSIHTQSWPQYDPKLLEEKEVTIVVQVNGKLKDSIQYPVLSIKYKDKIEERARQSEKIKKYIEGKTIRKVVYVEGKVINFVVSSSD